MKLKIKVISFLLILLFISISAVSAVPDNNQTIDTTDNEIISINAVEEIETSTANNVNTFTDLQDLIKSAKEGETITLENDYLYNDDYAGGYVGGVVINKASLTIDGNGHSIDGNKKSRILFINTDYNNVILKNINFINGFSTGAGAISCKAPNLQIINCTFTNNDGGNLVGGAVAVFSNNATIRDSKFTNNIVSQSGGALRLEGLNHKIIGNIFTSNTATEKLGGAISALTHNTIISNNTFSKNIAGRDGGAFNIQGLETDSHGIKNIISDNKFYENQAIYGGAASLKSEDCSVINNEFISNYATELGGAIRIAGAKKTTGIIDNNIFKNNYAHFSGGTIYIAGNGTILSKNTFTNSSSITGAGGTFDIYGENTIIKDNVITESNAKTIGGAIYISGKNPQITGNEISQANAEGNGGAIYLEGNSAVISDNKIYNSKTGSFGGALLIKSNKASITNNEFSQNIAKASGGAIYLEGLSVTLSSNNFTANQAGSNSVGGAVRWIGDEGNILNNRFIRNSANVGLDIYGSGKNPTISDNYYSSEESIAVKWEGGEKIKTTLTVPNKSYSIIVTSKSITATLKDANGKTISGKEIEFNVNGNTLKASTNEKGVATVKASLSSIKTYLVTAKFKGDNTYEAISQTAKVSITKDKVKATTPNKSCKKSAKSKKLTFTLKTSTNKVLKGKKITFKVDKKTYTAKTNTKGVATVNIKLTKKGTFKVTAKFAGDKTYTSISKTIKLSIK